MDNDVCFIDVKIPAWLGHRLEGVMSLFPDYSNGSFFCTVIDLGCTAMIELYEKRKGDHD